MINADNDMVVKSIENGSWETKSREIWKDIVASLPSKSVIWDVGAYSGYYSLISANISNELSVYAFEANINVYRTLSANIVANEFDIKASNVAMSDSNGMIALNITNDILMPSGSSIVDIGKPVKRSLIVEAITGDTFASKTEMPNLIKIDVEGAELKVLEGMANIFNTTKPTMLIEILSDDLLSEIVELLSKFNYSYSKILENGIESTSDRNYLFK